MNVAMLHYHLAPGGVTRVIASQVMALARLAAGERPTHIAVIAGRPCDGWPTERMSRLGDVPLTLRVVPRLEYDCGTTMRRRIFG